MVQSARRKAEPSWDPLMGPGTGCDCVGDWGKGVSELPSRRLDVSAAALGRSLSSSWAGALPESDNSDRHAAGGLGAGVRYCFDDIDQEGSGVGALKGKTALVTGASRGIGRGIARRLAQDGALVAVHYGRNQDAAMETVELVRKEGGRAFPLEAELGVPGDAERLYARFDAEMGRLGEGTQLDILVNNAGASGSARISEVTPELFDRLFAVNTKALLFLVQLGLERMGGGGRIINISSAVTRIAYPRSVIYSMTKGAVDTLTLALAKELGPRGITVNAVAPGFVATDMNAALRDTPQGYAQLAALSVFDRIGRPGDVGDIVAFLASDASRWITGQRIDATGGSML